MELQCSQNYKQWLISIMRILGCRGGKALLQWYENSDRSDSDCEADFTEKTKRIKREISHKPLILIIVTPLMARAHAHIQQAYFL